MLVRNSGKCLGVPMVHKSNNHSGEKKVRTKKTRQTHHISPNQDPLEIVLVFEETTNAIEARSSFDC
jgi:hypothetical protein